MTSFLSAEYSGFERDRKDRWMVRFACPSCGEASIERDLDCPGYPDGNGQIMVCAYGCGNADLFVCHACGWWYREPNRRTTVNYQGIRMGERPDWLDEELES